MNKNISKLKAIAIKNVQGFKSTILCICIIQKWKLWKQGTDKINIIQPFFNVQNFNIFNIHFFTDLFKFFIQSFRFYHVHVFLSIEND